MNKNSFNPLHSKGMAMRLLSVLMIALASFPAFAQNQVKGIVYGDDGEPLIGDQCA